MTHSGLFLTWTAAPCKIKWHFILESLVKRNKLQLYGVKNTNRWPRSMRQNFNQVMNATPHDGERSESAWIELNRHMSTSHSLRRSDSQCENKCDILHKILSCFFISKSLKRFETKTQSFCSLKVYKWDHLKSKWSKKRTNFLFLRY